MGKGGEKKNIASKVAWDCWDPKKKAGGGEEQKKEKNPRGGGPGNPQKKGRIVGEGLGTHRN